MKKVLTLISMVVLVALAAPAARGGAFSDKYGDLKPQPNVNVLKSPLKTNDAQKVKAAKMKAETNMEGQAFTGAMHKLVAAEATFLKAAIENIESDKAVFEKRMEENLSSIVSGRKPANFREFEKIQISMNGIDRQAQTVANHPRRAGEELVTPPVTATVETWYTASGTFYAYSSGWVDATSNMKSVNVAIDGTDIYIQGLAYWFKEGWIQGTITGTTATFANVQLIGEDEYGPEYIVGSEDGQTVSENIVFNYDAEEGALEAVTTYIIENSKTDEVSPYCYWASPTFTKNEPVGPEVVTPPAGVEAVDYVMTYTTGSTPVKVAVDGNDVYFQGMSKYIPEAWVKGTKDGNNVTFAGNQFMGEYANMESYFFYTGATTFVYDAEADTYSATGQVFGVLGGQYYDGNYTDPVLSRVVETAATPANPAITALTNGNYGWYITFNVPLQDTEGNALVASKLSYEIFTDVQQEVAPLTFTPATHSKLTEDMTVIPYGFTENYDFYDTQIYLNDLYSASWNKIGIKSIYTGGGETRETEIQWFDIKPYGEPTAETGENVYAPYSNALATEADFADFGVLDSNNDGKTWNFSSSYGAYYNYSSSSNADDWLISPAIKLEAGKKYHFAIDAACASPSYPERFEVLMGTEAKASALTQIVIEATDVAAKEFATYESETVEVAETGYYHFGIHAISDADLWRLMVKNFLVEAGPEPTAPAAVTDFDVVQTSGKMEAVVSFKAPTKTIGGDDLTDLTKIDILRDGEVINSFENVEANSISWTASEQGYENAQDINFIDFGEGVAAGFDGGGNSNTPKYYTSGTALRMYGNNTMTIVGNGIKKVVFTLTGNEKQMQLTANVGEYALDGNVGTWTGSANEIIFTVPTGYQARIQKIEIESGMTLTPGAEYSFADNAEDLTIGTHVYQVIPYNTSGAGIKSEEKEIFLSIALDVPYTFNFSQNLLDLFTIIDNNYDGKTWQWNSSNGYAYYPYSSTNAADDYLITLPFNLTAGKRYNVIVNARNSGYTETFEVKAGKEATVEGLTETVIAETELTGELNDYEGVFVPAEDGLYYFAIHATSPADQYNLIVKSLAISIAPELTAPAAVADLTATAGPEGALEAYLTFTAPATDIKGDLLTGNVDVMIYRDGELVNILEGVAPGAATTWVDANVENGKLYTYYIIASNDSGEGLKSDKVSVFVGEDELATVENVQMTGTTANTISLSWDPVTGANGGYVNSANVKYAVVSTHLETYMYWQYLAVDDVLGTVTGETSGTFNYDTSAGDQEYKYFGVVALKPEAELPEAGAEYVGGYTWALMGAPYELPFFESFTGSALHYMWNTNGTLIVDQESSDDDGVAVDLLAGEAGVIYFQSGKININSATNPTLLFSAKSPNISKLYVYVSMDGGNMTSIAELNLASSYQTFDISLADLKNKANYIQFAFIAQFNTPYTVNEEGTLVDLGDYITLDEIRVQEPSEYNLGEMVYNIDYSSYNGFPFYVMGYVPEWIDGVMTDCGGMYTYKTDEELANYQMPEGAEEVGIVYTHNGTLYHKIKLTSSGWHQYFIADGIPTAIDGNYIVRAKVRASEPCTINVNMGWGWQEGQTLAASVAIGTEWQEVEWAYSGIGGTSCNLVAQPGNCAAQIEWASIAIYNKKAQEPENIVWTIAGSSEIFGSYWDPTDTNNDMTEVENGVFELTKKSVSLKAGAPYEFKVVGNHSWDLNYGDGGMQNGPNVVFYVDRDGSYDLKFVFERNNGNKLSYSYEYIPSGPEPGSLDVVDYSIDYSTYSGFPFYVMGYVPEWIGGVMTDCGSMYTYRSDSDMDGYELPEGAEEVGIVYTQSGIPYHKIKMTSVGWHQYFIADGVNTADMADVYIVKAMVRASEACTINVNMGWGWGDGQQVSASVAIGTEWQEVEWEYSGIGGASCNLIAQPGTFVGTIEWRYLMVGHKDKSHHQTEWVENLTNGDAEMSWAAMGLADVVYNDMNNNYKICAWSKEKGRNMNENDGWDPFPTSIEVDPDNSDNHVFVVHAQPATTEGDASAWDNQFWIESPKAWKSGDQVKIHFRYKASQPVKTNTQMHKQNPSDYLIWHAIGDINFTTEWQEFDGTMTIGDDMNGGWSIAFNLNPENKDAIDFYFDDLSWQSMVLEEGYFVAGINTLKGTSYDFDSAIKFDEYEDWGYVATIGTRGNKDSYVDQIMISTVIGNDVAFKSNTLKPYGRIENDPDSWLDYTTAANAKLNLPAVGVWRIYIDPEYKAMAFEMLEGQSLELADIITNGTEVVVHGQERDDLRDDEHPDATGAIWDNQFFLVANRVLEAGEETIVRFEYKATKEAKASTQSHGVPGAYIHWAAIGDVYFYEDWQTFETTFTIPSQCEGKDMRTIAFNLAEIKDANDYHFRNFQWYLASDEYDKTQENLINQEGVENFFVKEGAGNGIYMYDINNNMVWTIAGSEQIFGSNWNPEDTNNDMTEVEEGVYVLTKQNIYLEAGIPYVFKVVGNHSWNINYGANGERDGANVEFFVDQDGIYNLQFVFNRNDNNWLSYSYEYVSDGTIDVPTALAIISELAEGKSTSVYYKVKGIVTEIQEISTDYGNATFYIQSPEVSNQTLLVYRCYGLNGERINDPNLFEVGDEVLVYSRLQNYRGTPETRQGGYLLSITHNATPATLLARLTEQIAATEATIASLVYPNVPGITELNALVAEAKTATEESGTDVLRNYITQLVNLTKNVVNMDQNYQSLAALLDRVELVIQNNPSANPDLAVEATNKIQEARTALNNGAYTQNDIWNMMNLMNNYYEELSKVYLTIDVAEAGTLKSLIEEKGFEVSNVIGLTVSGTLNWDDQNTLSQMYNIEHLNMAETNITEIWGEQFEGRPLKTVVLPKNLQRINYYAFAWCENLTAIELPASLQYLGYGIFEGCYNLQSITYNSIIPLELYDELTDWDIASQCTLYVPSIVVSVYQSMDYWNWFQIVGTDMIPEDIIVSRPISVDWPEGVGTAFKPNVTITNSLYNSDQYGSLTINGNSTISMNNFNILWDSRRSEYYTRYNNATGSYDYYRYAYSTLMANAPMRADNVSVSLNTWTYRWNFLSFPFDVKVGDIVNLNQTNAPLVIRRYDGQNRADGKMGETWVNMTPDMTLEAGKGYIWQSAEGDQNNGENNFSVRALDNAKKNNIFTANDVTVQLEEHLSEFSQNRSWNLIGNPYPAFYDIRGMQTTAPITIWNAYNNVYEAYTPGDDNYILNPGQAFFIQRPLDMENLTFVKEGRQLDLNVRDDVTYAAAARAAAQDERYVFNLLLTGSEEAQGDRTRIVFNAIAKSDYEAGRDASKFMSPEASAAQIYTNNGGVRYAINERPAMDGIVELGLSIGKAGNYTIALNTTVDNEVYLIDRETGNETRIDGGSTYTFNATKGIIEGRFALRFGNGEVTGIKSMASDSNNADNWYNLKGQRVSTPAKGLYIQNNKKTVVK